MADADSKACEHCGKLFARPITTPPTNTRFCSFACRFWAKVDNSGGSGACWLWTARAVANFGYGALGGADKTKLRAHRVAWELTNGTIPAGLFVLHKCDTPACCNPAHLFLGTHQENMIDMHAKGRGGMSPEGMERLKASKRGKARPPEVREKLRLASLGQKHSAEHIAKSAAANRGKKRSEETKQRMRDAWALRKSKQAGVWMQAK